MTAKWGHGRMWTCKLQGWRRGEGQLGRERQCLLPTVVLACDCVVMALQCRGSTRQCASTSLRGRTVHSLMHAESQLVAREILDRRGSSTAFDDALHTRSTHPCCSFTHEYGYVMKSTQRSFSQQEMEYGRRDSRRTRRFHQQHYIHTAKLTRGFGFTKGIGHHIDTRPRTLKKSDKVKRPYGVEDTKYAPSSVWTASDSVC